MASDPERENSAGVLAALDRLIANAGSSQRPNLVLALSARLSTLAALSALDGGFNTVLKFARDRQRGTQDPPPPGSHSDGVWEARGRHVRDREPVGDGSGLDSGANGEANSVAGKAGGTQEDRPLTYDEAAVFLSMSPSYVETLVRQGKLRAVTLPATDKGSGEHRRQRKGRQRRILRADLMALLVK